MKLTYYNNETQLCTTINIHGFKVLGMEVLIYAYDIPDFRISLLDLLGVQ